jgi:DNA-directed RNA polymerase specialized sigma24 family protein
LRLAGIEKPADIARSIGCPVEKVYKAIQKIRLTLDKLLRARGEARKG